MAQQKVGVSERALLQRINRKLKPENETVKAARMYNANGVSYENSNLGRFYSIDLERNHIIDHHIDLEAYGRELGVLAAWEELSDQPQSKGPSSEAGESPEGRSRAGD
jgi:hypothetical protein